MYVELNGGLANQLFQWAVVTHLLDDSSASPVWDYRRALRPNGRGRQLARVGIDDRPALLGSPVVRGLQRALHRLPRRISAPLMARLPSSPPARGLVQRTEWRPALDDLLAGRSVWLRDYLIDPEAIAGSRPAVRAAVRPALAGRGATDGAYACLHVRRGDYLDPIVAAKLGPCSTAYYIAAVAALDRDLPVRIVSDDPGWCTTELLPRLDRAVEVVAGGDDLDDLATICGASAVVMSNSTFSWWGAFLSEATAVIGPTPFFDFDPAGSAALTGIASTVLTKTDGAATPQVGPLAQDRR